MRESWGDRDPFLQVNVVSLIGPCNFSFFPVSVCGSETGGTCILKNMHSGFDHHTGQPAKRASR